MVFSTVLFLFRFLPITLLLYYAVPYKFKNTVLFACSLVFYSWGEVKFFPIMVVLILINYVSGLLMERFEGHTCLRRVVLVFSIVGSLSMLVFFKYTNFLINSLNALAGLSIAPVAGLEVLPLGISFYTFQTMSYSIDVYRQDVKTEHNIIDFGAYVVMFPQLIAGPIVKYRDVSNQLHVYEGRITLDRIEQGVSLFVFGLAKKVLLADAIGQLWTDIIGVKGSTTAAIGLANASTPLVWLGVIAYSLQLYFDFSGYSMMGIGMGKMLGFDFPDNFNLPYISRSITEFWRRWHMTLSGWFREYVYIPLGGNRKGTLRTYLNILIVFTASGLWHGANYTFILWGILHGLFSVVNRRWKSWFQKLHPALSWLITFSFLNLTMSLFRANSVTDAITLVKRLLVMDFGPISSCVTDAFLLPEIALLIRHIPFLSCLEYHPAVLTAVFYGGAMVLILGARNSYEHMLQFRPNVRNFAGISVLLAWCILSFSSVSTFLYFNF